MDVKPNYQDQHKKLIDSVNISIRFDLDHIIQLKKWLACDLPPFDRQSHLESLCIAMNSLKRLLEYKKELLAKSKKA